MARIRAFLSVPGWIRRTAPETKRAARNSTIFPAIPRPVAPNLDLGLAQKVFLEYKLAYLQDFIS